MLNVDVSIPSKFLDLIRSRKLDIPGHIVLRVGQNKGK